MEFVTPEEIADVVARELKGGNTGHDVINALDNAVMGPTYRAGLMRHWALEKLRALEKQHGVRSVAFENLGPPRLSKLLFEADLLRRAFGTMDRGARGRRPPDSPPASSRELARDHRAAGARSSPSASRSCCPTGGCCAGPSARSRPWPRPPRPTRSRPSAVEAWAHAGWVDLREANMARWKERFERIAAEIEAIPAADTSSRFLRDRQFWGAEGLIQPGKVVGWIFATEEKGARMK